MENEKSGVNYEAARDAFLNGTTHARHFVQDRDWMVIMDAVEQRIKASNYEMTLWLIVRQFREHVAPIKGSYNFDRMDDKLVFSDRRELLQGVLNILKFREPDMYADILAAEKDITDKAENGPRPEELEI